MEFRYLQSDAGVELSFPENYTSSSLIDSSFKYVTESKHQGICKYALFMSSISVMVTTYVSSSYEIKEHKITNKNNTVDRYTFGRNFKNCDSPN